MIKVIINWILSILGLDKKPNRKIQSLEESAKKTQKKLEEIENEKTNIDDILERLNRD